MSVYAHELHNHQKLSAAHAPKYHSDSAGRRRFMWIQLIKQMFHCANRMIYMEKSRISFVRRDSKTYRGRGFEKSSILHRPDNM